MPTGPEQETIHWVRDAVELVTGFDIGDSDGASSEGFGHCH